MLRGFANLIGIRLLLFPWFLSISTTVSAFLPCLRRDWNSDGIHATRSASKTTPQVDATLPTRIVVVGGGIGGLAVAARLAKAYPPPVQIQILEKNARVGGRAGSVNVTLPHGVFRHETGPSLLLLPHIYRRIFDECGTKPMEDYGLTLRPCLPAYQAVFDDGDCIQVGFPRQSQLSNVEQEEMEHLEQESRQKMDSWETNGSTKWDAYLRACEAFLDCGLPNFIEERLDLTSFPAFLQQALVDFGKAWPLKPHSDVLDAFFESNKLKALASFQDLYVGLEPYRNNQQTLGGVLDSTAPAVFGLLSAIELHPENKKCGVFAPVGGFDKVAGSLQALAEDLGVDILTGRTVTKVTSEGIWYREDSNPDNEAVFKSADLVIVNADLPYATESLLRDSESTEDRFDWDDKYRFSSGVLAFHWSLDKTLDKLNTHNVFLSCQNRQDMEASWDTLRDPSSAPAVLENSTPFNFYVHRASKTDPSAAPKGMDSIMILVPCPILKRNLDMARVPRKESIEHYQSTVTKETIDAARNAVLDRMRVVEPNVKDHIMHEFVDTPATYADSYHVGAGTPFALSHGLGQLSLTRPGARACNLPNVLFVGASSRPGNGVPLVLVGAERVADRARYVLEKLLSTTM